MMITDDIVYSIEAQRTMEYAAVKDRTVSLVRI